MLNQPKKIAFIATVYRHLEAFHLPFIHLLKEKGYEVHAISRPDHGKDGLVREKIPCHDIAFHRNPFHPSNVSALHRLYQLLKQQNYQMVHVHTPVGGILGRLAAWKTTVPSIIYTAHGFHFYKGGKVFNWLFYPIEKYFAKMTDSLITINKEDFNRARCFPVKKQVLYIPGVGMDTSAFQFQNESDIRKEKRIELGFADQDFVLICVAEINKNKNQIQLLRAIESLKDRYPFLKCLIVGEGRGETKLRKKASKLLLEERIKFCGFRRDIPELLISSDVLCLLSKREGLPKAIMEGLAAKKPIIATDIRGNRDLVLHESNGFLVPVNDITSTASSISKLIDDPFLKATMGKKSKELSKNYDLQVILPQMERVYEHSLL
ncbi:hypothetical protein AC623_02350 [Bacillus sp. FJAT-27231]|uniref:glycosyltransferase family 4 protein n=1 Tax=Bacillus sp. FJAT-27231 TaxID=1679168 RepID=UPI000670E136|nr:glycosyltransferase family 4 protein [Bacillus sp. FJAT-27231]KMY52971.1 hypothetical protein AC623_02350 [Bacillus sp. FJAT-27231]